ncbi:glycosyltransferase family 32 protein [Acinetobacter soli]
MLPKSFKDSYFFFKALWRYICGTPEVSEKWMRSSSTNNLIETKEINIPKKIWMYWDSVDRSDFIELCIQNTKKICFDYEIVVLDSTSVKKYIDLPDFEKHIPLAVKADFIRLALLNKYGGIWMDASIFITENFNWFLKKMNSKETFVFYSDHCTTNMSNPIVENWFIAAPEHSVFIADWFDEFKQCIFSRSPTEYYKDYSKRMDIIQNIPNTDYLMCYISAAVVRNKKSYDICMLNSGSQGHYYNYTMFSNPYFVAKQLLDRNHNCIFIPKIVKFTSQTRSFIEKKILVKDMNVSSLIGKSYHEVSEEFK